MKPTMTRYRADLLRSLPLDLARLRAPKKWQLCWCIKHLTEAGKKAVADFGPYESIPWSYVRDG